MGGPLEFVVAVFYCITSDWEEIFPMALALFVSLQTLKHSCTLYRYKSLCPLSVCQCVCRLVSGSHMLLLHVLILCFEGDTCIPWNAAILVYKFGNDFYIVSGSFLNSALNYTDFNEPFSKLITPSFPISVLYFV